MCAKMYPQQPMHGSVVVPAESFLRRLADESRQAKAPDEYEFDQRLAECEFPD